VDTALRALAHAALPATPKALTAAKVVDKLKKYYRTTKKLQAEFTQTYTNVTFGKEQSSQGTLRVARPGKMRWDYKSPTKKFFISDGKTLWAYEPAAKQAYKTKLKDALLPVAITFLYGEGDLNADFTVAFDQTGVYGGKDDFVLKLTPKQASAQYTHLWLVVHHKDFYVQESIILEATGNVNRFRFTKVRLNDATDVEDKLFKFTPPKGVTVR